MSLCILIISISITIIVLDNVKKVTQAMYEVLNKESDLSTALSTFLYDKVCDLYLICEECNQIEG